MYGVLWRLLPGPAWLRILLLLLLAVGALFALVTWVFPWADTTFATQPGTLDDTAP